MLGTMTATSSASQTHTLSDHYSSVPTASTTILLVHPSSSERRRLSATLETLRGTIREFASSGELLSQGELPKNSCLVCDADLGGTSGLHLIAHLHSMGIVLPSVMLVSPGDVHGAVAAMKAGVGEVVVKPIDAGELLHAVRTVVENSRVHGASHENIAELLRRRSRLSSRELGVFRLITHGLSNKQAAAELQLAVKTVEIHRANVMRKMECESLAQLVRQAVTLESVPTPLNEHHVHNRGQ